MIDVLSVDEQVILAPTALMPSVMAVKNLAPLPRTYPTRFLHQEFHTTMADLIQDINTSTTRGTDHTPIMTPDVADISAGHSPAPIPTTTQAAVLEGTPCALLPATTAACATLQPMDASITPYAMIVTSHPTHATSPTGTTHTTPQTRVSLVPATPTTYAQGSQLRKVKQCPRPLNSP